MSKTIDEKLNILINRKKQIDKEIKKLTKIKNSSCLICCEHIKYDYEFNCCNKIICNKCIFNHIKTIIDDIQIKAIKCPFCNDVMPYNKIYQICRLNKEKKYSEKYKNTFQQMIKYKKSSDIKEFSKILDQDKIYSFLY